MILGNDMENMNDVLESEETVNSREGKVCELKQYIQPELRKIGLMQKVTLGGSELCSDSGQGAGTGLNCP